MPELIPSRETEPREAAPAAAAFAGIAQNLDTLANLAHELRTPAQVLLGYLEILREDLGADLTSRTRPLIARMQSHAYDLTFAIENMLDFARARTSAPDVPEDEDVDLVELAAELMPVLEIANSAKGLKLSVDFSGTPSHVHTRHRALRAILLNLALNAIKFTTTGSVSITARQRAGTAAGEAIEFEVKDTGPGIGAAQLARAFEPWTQLSASTTRRYRGLGLGLAVVKRNVSAVGGVLKVDSAPDKGSRFTVTIPCTPATNGAAGHSTPIFRAPARPQLSAPQRPLPQVSRPRAPRSR